MCLAQVWVFPPAVPLEEAAGNCGILHGRLRDGRRDDITVVLGERPKDLASRESGSETPEPSAMKKFGLSVENLTPALARQLGYGKETGVLISDVLPGSMAEDAGLQKNDLIKEVNRTAVRSVTEFREAVERGQKRGDIALRVRRGETTFYVALQATS